MTALEVWLSRRVLIATILIGLLAVSVFFLARAKFGQAMEDEYASYSVTIEHFGVDSREIERSITIPLENEIGAIAGLREMRSTSEYGKSRVSVTTEAGADRSSIYLQLRDAADRVYRSLPQSAQKPQIGSSSTSQRAVFAASLRADGLDEDSLRELADKEIKPSFEKVSGVGDIEVGGGAVKEVHVLVDPARAASYGLSISSIAERIQAQDIIGPVGSVRDGSVDLSVSIRGRLTSLDALSELRIATKDGTVRLRDVAEVSYGYRESESVSRVDGEKMIVLYAQSSGSANLIGLSRSLRAESARWRARGIAVNVILDSGADLERALAEIVKAMIEGIAAALIVLPLAVPDIRRLGALSAAIAVVPIVSAAILSALGVGIDEYVLSGLAVGIGTIVDNGAIVVGLKNARSLALLLPSLGSSLLTTLIVLVPLFFLGFIAPGIKQISLAMCVLFIAAFIGTVLILPAFTVARVSPAHGHRNTIRARLGAARLARRLAPQLSARRALRGVSIAVRASGSHPAIAIAAACIVVAALCVSAALMGTDFSRSIEEDTIYAHLEFESGASIDSVDERTAVFAEAARRLPGATMVETIARRGNAEFTLKFDPKRAKREELIARARELGGRIPDGFVYFPEGSGDDRAYEIAVLGEDDEVLRAAAKEAARRLGQESWARQVVLNFKEAPKALVLDIDHAKAASQGVSAAAAASAMRWALYGPVAVKWVENDREYDLRVFDRSARSIARDELLDMTIRTGSERNVRISGISRLEEQDEGAKIFRKNRQRAAFFTVHSGGASVDETVGRIKGVLAKVALPSGYAFDMDRSVIELKRSFSTLALMLCLSVFLIFIVLASSMESLTCPFIVLSILPTSLAFPVIAFFIAGMPLRIPALVGLIMLSGMAVNNSILIANEIRARGGDRGASPASMRGLVIMAIRKRLKPLLISSGMTLVGTLPLLFAGGSGGAFMRTISFVVFWGIIGSLVSTFLVLPALSVSFPGAFKALRFGTRERSAP
jgi:multidrug efflux pump subunit AcrB